MECKFCQNWEISQFRPEQVESVEVTPERLIESVKARKCRTIAYTYSEPTISYEYVHDTAALARQAGIGSVIISNGYMQEKPLRQLCGQSDRGQDRLQGVQSGILRGHVRRLAGAGAEHAQDAQGRTGIWFELVVLIIPTKNDAADEIKRMSEWILKNLGPDVPVHFTRFAPTYRVKNLPPTPDGTLDRCRKTATRPPACTTFTSATCRRIPARTPTAISARPSSSTASATASPSTRSRTANAPSAARPSPASGHRTRRWRSKPREAAGDRPAATRPASRVSLAMFTHHVPAGEPAAYRGTACPTGLDDSRYGSSEPRRDRNRLPYRSISRHSSPGRPHLSGSLHDQRLRGRCTLNGVRTEAMVSPRCSMRDSLMGPIRPEARRRYSIRSGAKPMTRLAVASTAAVLVPHDQNTHIDGSTANGAVAFQAHDPVDDRIVGRPGEIAVDHRAEQVP